MQSNKPKQISGSYILKTEKEITGIEVYEMFFEIKDENNPDLVSIGLKELEKGSIGVGDIKEKLKEFGYKKVKHENKVLVIFDADYLTHEAQNSLLKTLEEPHKNNHIFLVCKNTNQFLPTILSRCQVITLKDTEMEEKGEGEGNSFLTLSLIEKLKEGDKILSEKDNITRKTMCFDLLEKVIRESKDLESRKEVEIGKVLLRFEENLNSEVNLRLCLENFIISLDHILHSHNE